MFVANESGVEQVLTSRVPDPGFHPGEDPSRRVVWYIANNPRLPANDSFWPFLDRCWDSDCARRPTVEDILAEVRPVPLFIHHDAVS